MPEGHTVHRIARDHTKTFASQKMIVDSPQGRFADEAKKLCGRHLIRAEAFGKHLIYQWGTKTKEPTAKTRPSAIMHVHLGLYGKFRWHKNPPPDPRGAVRVRMVGYERAFDLNGPNTCRLLAKDDFQKLTDRIGADPFARRCRSGKGMGSDFKISQSNWWSFAGSIRHCRHRKHLPCRDPFHPWYSPGNQRQ